ncbi:SMI1/KNR4 family protein [Pontibacter qinzhouensis]|uniref:SMI1/KNR4 family protein n=1 Tax=Pontibacter qinzhouensis TaxID=2603253 RepID=A0A5C8IH51_9BACT|nr:SMI1/KNR4 family protein [Pontibacter qinzhouensis]TXK21029.1 SMI1/KNR4 family protein [Pontibacter qinzhouensis]
MEILERLKNLSQPVPNPPPLPTAMDVKNAEEKLVVKFPPSYVKYQLDYSNLFFGTFEPYQLFEDGSYADLINSVKEARESGLPNHLLPFLEDNGDYFCFDLTSTPPEYEIKFWSHNGTSNEKWVNFLEWVEKCWIDEHV